MSAYDRTNLAACCDLVVTEKLQLDLSSGTASNSIVHSRNARTNPPRRKAETQTTAKATLTLPWDRRRNI